jgi:hypothetical protein
LAGEDPQPGDDTADIAPPPAAVSLLCGVPLRLAGWLAILIVPLSFALNYQFLFHCRYAEMMTMNDVSSIMVGYHRVPDFAHALMAYWHAPWIQEGINCFRPISGVQYWVETYVGLHWGFLWDAWIGGYALFAISAWLCAMIAYRLTGSVLLTIFAAVMACGVRFYNCAQPPLWLAWYPMHQDLLMVVFILGAVLAFDYWLASGFWPALAATWCLFVLGCLTKEYVYAFPFMAVSLAVYRPAGRALTRSSRLLQPSLFSNFVALLLLVRMHMYAVPRDPHFREQVILHKPAMFMYSKLALDTITANWGPIILAVFLVVVWEALCCLSRRHRPARPAAAIDDGRVRRCDQPTAFHTRYTDGGSHPCGLDFHYRGHGSQLEARGNGGRLAASLLVLSPGDQLFRMALRVSRRHVPQRLLGCVGADSRGSAHRRLSLAASPAAFGYSIAPGGRSGCGRRTDRPGT